MTQNMFNSLLYFTSNCDFYSEAVTRGWTVSFPDSGGMQGQPKTAMNVWFLWGPWQEADTYKAPVWRWWRAWDPPVSLHLREGRQWARWVKLCQPMHSFLLAWLWNSKAFWQCFLLLVPHQTDIAIQELPDEYGFVWATVIPVELAHWSVLSSGWMWLVSLTMKAMRRVVTANVDGLKRLSGYREASR